MNYRHAFHAGNFADVFKHAILCRILTYLMRKDSPLRFLDTHAGLGSYSLAGKEAQRSGEWREGVARLLKAAPPTPIKALLAPYRATLGALTAAGAGGRYPGSPVIAQALLRAQDRLSLCEMHPEDRASLALTWTTNAIRNIDSEWCSKLRTWPGPPGSRARSAGAGPDPSP